MFKLQATKARRRKPTPEMFERPRSGELAILVTINNSATLNKDTASEFKELALAAGAIPLAIVSGTRTSPDAKYYVGKGKAEEIKALIQATNAELILFNHTLSPSQERNLEAFFQCRVLDRTGLILDIFAQRARTFEGKLQVELAQLQHIATRLVRGWTHLERQRGGIGLRGPGETQLETDRRLIRTRIKTISKRLEKVRTQRAQGRRARRRSDLVTISLVGYTNAGKSTLFNQLSDENVYVADQPFATLDPTLRRVELPNGRSLILADTVGFIQDLPHDLIDAFQATLEETQQAHLLIHVVDAANGQHKQQIEEVNRVLKEIDADKIPQLIIYNKIDLLPETDARLERDSHNQIWRIWLSAATGNGINFLQQALMEWLEQDMVYHQMRLAPSEGKLRALLYDLKAVEEEKVDEEGNWQMAVRLSKNDFNKIKSGDPR